MHHENAQYCPYCGEPVESLVQIEDNDPDVGYRALEELCPRCLAAVRIADCAYADLQPWTPLILGWPRVGRELHERVRAARRRSERFRELMPILNGRQVLLTVSRIDDTTIRVSIVAKRHKEGTDENGLCTPLTITGRPEELDREFATQFAGYTAWVVKLSSDLAAVEAAHTAALKAVGEDKKKELDRKRGKPSGTSSPAAAQTNAGPAIKDRKPVFGTKGAPTLHR